MIASGEFAFWVVALSLAVLLLALQGCVVGTAVVSHEFAARTARLDVSNEPIADTHGRVKVVQREQLGLKATRAEFNLPHSRWVVSTLNDSVVLDITNIDKESIAIRLDEITLASNFAPRPTPMVLAKDSRHRRVGHTAETSFEKPGPERIASGARQGIYLDPDFSALFPNKTLFNVKRAFGSTELLDSGAGNILTLVIPIETTSGKETLRIDLRLTGSSTRMINF